ncbi:hypothetical protein OIU85_000163 [Salix viminalis]|uniref:Cysteine-rich transmembrane domain-containing protein n=1 Tax=Salix viminalis TaxID=40686 RepID=A0A9Q0VIZ4_SALVM|nr:hypothetical protein OIU85_000163 [Salix viminalis]KAJ6749493.1 hypothetical protein OIU85_000163 [Salix viminalis]
MSQNQATVAYPPPPAPTGPSAYSAAPPPAGYPTMDDQTYLQNPIPVKTKSRGDGFWKGCCAALCCCCVLDACF